MQAAGIDIGGSKIELRVFGPDWAERARRRLATPSHYEGLLAVVAELWDWAAAEGADVVGICAPGRPDPASGRHIAANFAASGKPFAADLGARLGRPVPVLHDAAALALSEAHLGAGRGAGSVAALVLGTGVGAGLVTGGNLWHGATGAGGEIGHLPLPASAAVDHGLPILPCGCGRQGCLETLLAGPGLSRIDAALGGPGRKPAELVGRAPGVWAAWEALAGHALAVLAATWDPEMIVLGGGLSSLPELAPRLAAALDAVALPGLARPEIRVADAGDASGARGAALAAARAART